MHDLGLPNRLTLAGKSIITPILNPLTSFPALAHRRSRSPSPDNPAGPHPGSRKASPDRAGSPTRQGFAVALTFLTGIKGVYFYVSQARFPPRVLQDIHNSTQPTTRTLLALRSRETTDRSRIVVKTYAYTKAYGTKFDLFHAIATPNSTSHHDEPPAQLISPSRTSQSGQYVANNT
jgi:hypothetical protein